MVLLCCRRSAQLERCLNDLARAYADIFDVEFANVSNTKGQEKGKCIWTMQLVPKDRRAIDTVIGFKQLSKDMVGQYRPMNAYLISCGLSDNNNHGILVRYAVANCRGHGQYYLLPEQPQRDMHGQPPHGMHVQLLHGMHGQPPYGMHVQPPHGMPQQPPPEQQMNDQMLNEQQFGNMRQNTELPQNIVDYCSTMTQFPEGKLSELDAVFLHIEDIMAIIDELGRPI